MTQMTINLDPEAAARAAADAAADAEYQEYQERGAWLTVPADEQEKRRQAIDDDMPAHLLCECDIEPGDREAVDEAPTYERHFLIQVLNMDRPDPGRIVTAVILTASNEKLEVWLELVKRVRTTRGGHGNEIWTARQARGTTNYR